MNVTDIVAKQYTEWSYPKPIPDMVEAIAQGIREPDTPTLITPILWPERRSLTGLKVLVAGCGTNQGAYYAVMMPEAQVTGIDLSLTSLNHEKFLVERHAIENLTLRQMSLLEVGTLGETYDFIICCGVLHHLDDPDAGLRALRDVLRPDGMMSVMIYAPYLRIGVYMLQDAFRILGMKQSKEEVQQVKAALKHLPPRHWANFYIKNAPDIGYDSGIVDTFLHSKDRSYTVGELLEFARRNGLEFWEWVEPAMYSHTQAFPPEHPLRPKISALPPEERWKVIELLTQSFGFHQFFLCHPSRVEKRISFGQADWLNFVPVFKPGLKIVEQEQGVTPQTKLQRGRYRFRVAGIGSDLIKCVDGERAISKIIELCGSRMQQLSDEAARQFFASMYERGHLMYWRC